MPVIRRNSRVPYSALQMLTLVNDVATYPEFLNWCTGARIEKDNGAVVDAAMDIGVGGVHKTMRTRNTTHIAEDGDRARIDIEMINGPLSRMHGSWQFVNVPAGGCDVTLELEYDTHRTPFGLLLRKLFDEIANSQLNAFTRRADRVYRDA